MPISLGAAALIGGGSLLGGLIGGGANYATSAQAVKKQIEWERERAKNAHQWEVQDLQAAGLNPILSAGGSGATTGGISAPQPDMSPIANALPNAMTALQAYADTENKNAQTRQADANTALTLEATRTQQQKTITEMRNQGLITQQTAKVLAEMNFKEQEIKKLQQDMLLERKEFDFRIEQIQADIENAKANKNYARAKTLESEQETIRKQKENKAFWVDKVMTHIYKTAEATHPYMKSALSMATPWIK